MYKKKKGLHAPSSTSIIIPCFFIASHRVATSGVTGYKIAVPSANIYHTLFILSTPFNSHNCAMPRNFHCKVVPVGLAAIFNPIAVREEIHIPFYPCHIFASLWAGLSPRPACFIRAESICFRRKALSNCRNDARPAEGTEFFSCLCATLEAGERALIPLPSRKI